MIDSHKSFNICHSSSLFHTFFQRFPLWERSSVKTARPSSHGQLLLKKTHWLPIYRYFVISDQSSASPAQRCLMILLWIVKKLPLELDLLSCPGRCLVPPDVILSSKDAKVCPEKTYLSSWVCPNEPTALFTTTSIKKSCDLSSPPDANSLAVKFIHGMNCNITWCHHIGGWENEML